LTSSTLKSSQARPFSRRQPTMDSGTSPNLGVAHQNQARHNATTTWTSPTLTMAEDQLPPNTIARQHTILCRITFTITCYVCMYFIFTFAASVCWSHNTHSHKLGSPMSDYCRRKKHIMQANCCGILDATLDANNKLSSKLLRYAFVCGMGHGVASSNKIIFCTILTPALHNSPKH
jgi:hypothetical protein